MTTVTQCSTCRGIHILVAPKFCPACGEPLLELPNATDKVAQISHPQATDAEIKHAAQFSPGSVTPAVEVVSLATQDVQHAAGNNLIVTLRKAMESLKHVTRELERWRCEAKNWRDVAEKLQQQADAKFNTGTDCCKDMTVNTAEPFTTAQMLTAIDQWLAFGERMLAVNQHGGYFAYSGWAARAIRAVRNFIEKAGAE